MPIRCVIRYNISVCVYVFIYMSVCVCVCIYMCICVWREGCEILHACWLPTTARYIHHVQSLRVYGDTIPRNSMSEESAAISDGSY